MIRIGREIQCLPYAGFFCKAIAIQIICMNFFVMQLQSKTIDNNKNYYIAKVGAKNLNKLIW